MSSPRPHENLESLYVVYRVRHQVAHFSSREKVEVKLLQVFEEIVSERILYLSCPAHYEVSPAEAENAMSNPRPSM